MACDGWSVGDRCRARVAFQTIERQIGGPDLLTSIHVGDEGTVKNKISHVHMLYVFWQRLGKAKPVSHDQVHLLDKI